MHVQERFPHFQIPNGDDAEAPEKIDNSKVSIAYPEPKCRTYASRGS